MKVIISVSGDIQVGDYVEFLSDKQTEKGPSSGKVIYKKDRNLEIEHSDCIESFNSSELKILEKSTFRDTETPLWFLE